MLTKSLEKKYKSQQWEAKWNDITASFGERNAKHNYTRDVLDYDEATKTEYDEYLLFTDLLFVEKVKTAPSTHQAFVEIIIIQSTFGGRASGT